MTIYGPTAPGPMDLVAEGPGAPDGYADAVDAAFTADVRDPLQGPEPAYEYARDDVYEAEPG